MIAGVDDVEPCAVEESGEARDEAGLVRSGDEKIGSKGHRPGLSPHSARRASDNRQPPAEPRAPRTSTGAALGPVEVGAAGRVGGGRAGGNGPTSAASAGRSLGGTHVIRAGLSIS